jgi:hypothetical protein
MFSTLRNHVCLHCLLCPCLSSIIRSNLETPDKMRPISRAILRPYVCQSCRHGIGAGRRRFGSKSDSPDIYDVVCVGGGPAGLGLLAALRKYIPPADKVNID